MITINSELQEITQKFEEMLEELRQCLAQIKQAQKKAKEQKVFLYSKPMKEIEDFDGCLRKMGGTMIENVLVFFIQQFKEYEWVIGIGNGNVYGLERYLTGEEKKLIKDLVKNFIIDKYPLGHPHLPRWEKYLNELKKEQDNEL